MGFLRKGFLGKQIKFNICSLEPQVRLASSWGDAASLRKLLNEPGFELVAQACSCKGRADTQPALCCLGPLQARHPLLEWTRPADRR